LKRLKHEAILSEKETHFIMQNTVNQGSDIWWEG